MKTVLIITPQGFVPVRCFGESCGLAVTEGYADSAGLFVLTHVTSGACMGVTANKRRALEAMRVLGPLWNWAQSDGDLVASWSRHDLNDFFELAVRDAGLRHGSGRHISEASR